MFNKSIDYSFFFYKFIKSFFIKLLKDFFMHKCLALYFLKI